MLSNADVDLWIERALTEFLVDGDERRSDWPREFKRRVASA
jgi:hypothetical protein